MTTHDYEVGIVVPMFNSADTIRPTLDSIIQQTIFDRIHVVLVNNASTDSTGQIADEYAARYPNIEVTYRVGGGCGGARNAGIPLVRAPVVAFVDADDLLPPDSIEHRLGVMRRDDSDIVLCAIESFPAKAPYTPVDVYGTDRVVHGLSDDPGVARVANATHIMLRTQFFADPNNLFAEDTPFEDVPVTTAALAEAKRISISSKVGYLYRREDHRDSIMATAYTKASNYLAHVRVNTMVKDRHLNDPVAHRAFGVMRMRTMAAFLHRAHHVLDHDELRAFFDAAQSLMRAYPIDVLRAARVRPASALAAYAIITDDFELMKDPGAHLVGVEPPDASGHPYMVLDRPAVEPARPLLQIKRGFGWAPIYATIDSVATDPANDWQVTISGTLTAPAVEGPYPPLSGCGLRLSLGEHRDVAWLQATPTADARTWQFTCAVDVRDIEPGKHRIRISSNLRTHNSVRIQTHEVLRPAKGLKLRRNTDDAFTLLVVSKSRLAEAPA